MEQKTHAHWQIGKAQLSREVDIRPYVEVHVAVHPSELAIAVPLVEHAIEAGHIVVDPMVVEHHVEERLVDIREEHDLDSGEVHGQEQLVGSAAHVAVERSWAHEVGELLLGPCPAAALGCSDLL